MYLFEAKELFYHKGCKFTCVGVDQTLRRPLAVLLSEIAVEDRTTSKISGQFQKAKLRRANPAGWVAQRRHPYVGLDVYVTL